MYAKRLFFFFRNRDSTYLNNHAPRKINLIFQSIDFKINLILKNNYTIDAYALGKKENIYIFKP